MIKKRIFSLLFLPFLFQLAFGQAPQFWGWFGGTSTDWSTASNWSPPSVPANNILTIVNFNTYLTPTFSTAKLSGNPSFLYGIQFVGSGTQQYTVEAGLAGGFFINVAIDNQSPVPQTIVNSSGSIIFQNAATVNPTRTNTLTINNSSGVVFKQSASAGNMIYNGIAGPGVQSGILFQDQASGGGAIINLLSPTTYISFSTTSNAGYATINIPNTGSTPGGQVSFTNQTGLYYGTINLDAGTVSFQNTATAANGTIKGSTSGTGAVSFQDSATAGSSNLSQMYSLVFSGTSSAGSAVINNSTNGTITFQNTATAASASITNNNILQFQNSSTMTGGKIITTGSGQTTFQDTSVAGALNATNSSGTATLTFQSGAVANGTTINNNSGTLQFQNSSSAVNALITNLGNGTFQDTSVMSGGTLVNSGTGTMTFQAGASANNATLTNSGSGNLIFQNTASVNSTTINNNATLQFLNTPSASTATVVNNGSMDVSGLSAGYALTVGSVSGRGNINLGGSTLALGALNGTDTISGVIYDGGLGGSLNKVGTGTLILNNINTYTGATNINAGILEVGDKNNPAARIAGSVNINPGGALRGHGTVAQNVSNNGLIRPGSSLGALTIGGTYTQTSSGRYTVEVDTSGNSNLLSIGGAANLDGHLDVDVTHGFIDNYTYTILNAGIVNGRFISESLSQPYIIATVAYGGNTVGLILDFNKGKIHHDVIHPNQNSVANYIFGFRTTQLPLAVLILLANLTSAQQLQLTLDQLSGATFANQILAISRVAYGSGFESELADRFSQFPNCANNRYAVQENVGGREYIDCNQKRTFWIIGQGGKGQFFSGEESGLNFPYGGISFGYEFPVRQHAMVGTAFGFDHFSDTATLPEVATANGSIFQVGVYSRYNVKRWFLGGSFDFGASTPIIASRTIQLANVTVPSTYYTQLASEQLRVSYNLWGRIFRPFLGVFNQNVYRPTFTEPGLTGFELTVNQEYYHSLRSQLGIMLDVPTDQAVRPFLSAAWEHEFAQQQAQIQAQFAQIGGPLYFTAVGTAIGREIAVIKGGLVIVQQDKWDLSALYEGQYASMWRDYGGRVQVNIRF